MNECSVGMFKLPGLQFRRYELSNQLIDEMKEWSEVSKCGVYMSETLWSFRNANQRTMFVLRWSEAIESESKSD